MPPKRHSARCSEADTQPRFAAVGPAPPTRITGRRRRGRPYNPAASIVARISESSTAQYLSVVAMLWCPSSCIHDPDGLRAWLLNNCCRRRRSSSTRPASARIASSRACSASISASAAVRRPALRRGPCWRPSLRFGSRGAHRAVVADQNFVRTGAAHVCGWGRSLCQPSPERVSQFVTDAQ
jgi:hypothetical protein